MRKEEVNATIKLIQVYAETDHPVSIEFYRALCSKSVETLNFLKEKLLNYGKHTSNCKRHKGPDCDCGWDELKNLLEKQ